MLGTVGLAAGARRLQPGCALQDAEVDLLLPVKRPGGGSPSELLLLGHAGRSELHPIVQRRRHFNSQEGQLLK
jgi:hypothetical protein